MTVKPERDEMLVKVQYYVQLTYRPAEVLLIE